MKNQDLHTMICESAKRLGLGDIINHDDEFEYYGECDPVIVKALNARLSGCAYI